MKRLLLAMLFVGVVGFNANPMFAGKDEAKKEITKKAAALRLATAPYNGVKELFGFVVAVPGKVKNAYVNKVHNFGLVTVTKEQVAQLKTASTEAAENATEDKNLKAASEKAQKAYDDANALFEAQEAVTEALESVKKNEEGAQKKLEDAQAELKKLLPFYQRWNVLGANLCDAAVIGGSVVAVTGLAYLVGFKFRKQSDRAAKGTLNFLKNNGTKIGFGIKSATHNLSQGVANYTK